MRTLFNIKTLSQLEKAFELYKSHLSEEYSLNLKKKTAAQNRFAKFLGYSNYSEAKAMVEKNSVSDIEMAEMALGMSCVNRESFLNPDRDIQSHSIKIDLKNLDVSGVDVEKALSNIQPIQDLDNHPMKKNESNSRDAHVRIETTVYSDDGTMKVDFDSSEQFQAAYEKGTILEFIRDLAKDGFNGGYETDELAEAYSCYRGMDFEKAQVRSVFRHNEELPRGVEACGFSVTVQESTILKWVEVNTTPEILEQVYQIIEDES